MRASKTLPCCQGTQVPGSMVTSQVDGDGKRGCVAEGTEWGKMNFGVIVGGFTDR